MIVVTVTGKPTMQEDEDGRRWLVVIAAFFVQFIICGISYSLGIFQVVFQDVFSTDFFDTSWAGSIQLYVTALTSKCLIKLYSVCHVKCRALDKREYLMIIFLISH